MKSPSEVGFAQQRPSLRPKNLPSFKVSPLHIASIDKSSTHINVSDMILNIAKYGILTNILMRYSPAAAPLAALVADAQQSEAKVHFLKVYK